MFGLLRFWSGRISSALQQLSIWRKTGFRACRFTGPSSPVNAAGGSKGALTGRQECLPYARGGIYEEKDGVKEATLLPTELLALFSVPELVPVGQVVEQQIKAMIDEAVRPNA